MLLVFLALLLILANASSQASEHTFPKEAEEAFKALNKLYNSHLTWSDEWAKKALEWLKAPKSVEAHVIIKGKKAFPIMDDKLLWQKMPSVLEHRLDRRTVTIENLPSGTVYGCNGIIDTKGKKKVVVSAVCLYARPPKNFNKADSHGSGNPLPEESKETFKTLNTMFNENLIWSDEWAKKALEWLQSKKSVKADVIIRGKQHFSKDDTRLLWDKLLAILEHRFNRREKEIENLPTGTIYGCNGIINTEGEKDFIYTACLYKKP